MPTSAHDQHRPVGSPPPYTTERLTVCGLVAEISAKAWESFRRQRVPYPGGEDWFLVEADGRPACLFWRDGDRFCAMRLRSPSIDRRGRPPGETPAGGATGVKSLGIMD